MLKCISRYRNAQLGIYVEPGDVLKELSDDLEAQLLRDSPGSFEQVSKRAAAKALDAPPRHKMVDRGRSERKASERQPGSAMSSDTVPGLVAPKEDR